MTESLMEYLWDHVNKDVSGESVFFNDNDIEFLWHCGFIDTLNVPFAQWAAFFVPYKDSDTGAYLLDRTNFMLIEDLRYKGPIKEPFDFKRINEGFYTDQGLDELFELGVAPSVEATTDELKQFVATLKKDFRENKMIRVDKACKERIGQWMDEHPSPLRRLELIMDAGKTGKQVNPELIKFTPKGADPVAAMQVSVFSMRPGSVAQTKKEALKGITQTKEKKGADTKDTVSLKSIRRNPKGTRS